MFTSTMLIGTIAAKPSVGSDSRGNPITQLLLRTAVESNGGATYTAGFIVKAYDRLAQKAAALEAGSKVLVKGTVTGATPFAGKDGILANVLLNASQLVVVGPDEPDYNEIFINGNVGGDAESTTDELGELRTRFSIAHSYNVGSGSDRAQKTVWFRCYAGQRTAENLSRFAEKGRPLNIVGSLHATGYLRSDGTMATNLVVNVFRWTFAGKKPGESAEEAETRRLAHNNAVVATAEMSSDAYSF